MHGFWTHKTADGHAPYLPTVEPKTKLHFPRKGMSSIIYFSFIVYIMVKCTVEAFAICRSAWRYQWRLLRGGRLIIRAGTERMEWHQTMCLTYLISFHLLSCHYHEPVLPNGGATNLLLSIRSQDRERVLLTVTRTPQCYVPCLSMTHFFIYLTFI
jgi:hypothetical protein